MKHLAVCLACAVLFPLVWWDEKRERRQRQFVKAVADTIPRLADNPQVEVSDFGVFIGSPDVTIVAEDVSCDPAFWARA